MTSTFGFQTSTLRGALFVSSSALLFGLACGGGEEATGPITPFGTPSTDTESNSPNSQDDGMEGGSEGSAADDGSQSSDDGMSNGEGIGTPSLDPNQGSSDGNSGGDNGSSDGQQASDGDGQDQGTDDGQADDGQADDGVDNPEDHTPGQDPITPPVAPPNPFGSRNLFTEVLQIPVQEVEDKVQTAVNRFFGIGTGEPNELIVNTGWRDYYELPQQPSHAFIWAVDSNDIRSEGMSYGMMIAVQMDMQEQFDKLWRFARDYTQFRPGSPRDTVPSWRNYFRWTVTPVVQSANNWDITSANDGPAPDGEEYFAAALYLADRRWGSNGEINYEQEADNITNAMLNNNNSGGNTRLFDAQANQVVFYPNGQLANFSDPSYHLPAFYVKLFAEDGPQQDRNRWLQIAETSRNYFVNSANDQTGLHPDYAFFDGTPTQGGNDGAPHQDFRYDAWRVIMNMGVDVAWNGPNARMTEQARKYHEFFLDHISERVVTESLFTLAGQVTNDSTESSALTGLIGAGAQASDHPDIATYLNLQWNVYQQDGQYRYYQECAYLLSLLVSAGKFNYDWQ